MQQSGFWLAGFGGFVLVMLALDLGLLHRRTHVVRLREALLWSGFVILTAVIFNLGIWLGGFGGYEGAERTQRAQEFLTGYLLEYSLSVDNLFVFAVIFAYFGVPATYQHKVLFYGILGALVCRGVFISVGVELVTRFTWTLYVFGGLLIITGIKMAISKDKQIQPERNPVLRLARRFLPVAHEHVDGQFIVRVAGRRMATPLLLVLLLIETTDIVFAVDSIPAVLGVTQDRLIVYTSNVFAILGLRALYFALAGFIRMFRYLSLGLSVLLVFIGCKMLAKEGLHFDVPIPVALGTVVLVLAVSILASVLIPPRKSPTSGGPGTPAG